MLNVADHREKNVTIFKKFYQIVKFCEISTQILQK